MNKFEMFMIGSKKIPNLVFTKREKAVAWVCAIIYFIAFMGTSTVATVAVFNGVDIFVFGRPMAIVSFGMLIALLLVVIAQWVIIVAVARQYKDVI